MKAAPIILILTFFLFFYLNCANRSEKDGVDLPHESDTSTLPSKETPIAPITGIYWQLAALSGKPMAQLPAQNKEPYILFREDGIVEATGGCNGMSGQYEIMEGGKIKITRLVSTKMACPDMSSLWKPHLAQHYNLLLFIDLKEIL